MFAQQGTTTRNTWAITVSHLFPFGAQFTLRLIAVTFLATEH